MEFPTSLDRPARPRRRHVPQRVTYKEDNDFPLGYLDKQIYYLLSNNCSNFWESNPRYKEFHVSLHCLDFILVVDTGTNSLLKAYHLST